MSEIQDGNSLPFLKIGATLACVHSVGSLPVQSDESKDIVYYESDFLSCSNLP